MKKLIYFLLLLIPFLSIGQTANGTETTQPAFRSRNPQTVTSPNGFASMGSDGTIGRIPNVNMPFLQKSNFINIKDLGGVGDGIFDNTTIINNALSAYKEVYFPDGNYLVTSLANDLGTKITGSGIIRKAITGGTQQLNTGIDKYNYIFGQEYLSFVQSKQLTDLSFSTAPVKVSWSGDSTTAGDATTTPFNLNNLFLSLANEKGISNIASLNRGHSGANTEQWRTTYLAGDLAENPDLYIIRWGINDPGWLKNGSPAPLDSGDTYPNRRDIGDFETSLRSALTTIRASKTQAQMSIILMSPNSTSDTPNARDEKWYEQVRKVYIQAARDFKCAFIDTYGLWLDSRGAADTYMDNPFGDGRAIHPKDIFNTWVVSKVFNLVYPDALLNKVSDSHIYNQSSLDRLPIFSDAPNTYKRGLTLSRVQDIDGWNLDGSAFTMYNRDGVGGQFNFSRKLANPEIYYRAINVDPPTTPLSFSNPVRLWHDSNLPFVNSGSRISTALDMSAKSIKATGRIFITNNVDFADLTGTNGVLDLNFSASDQKGYISCYNFTSSLHKPIYYSASLHYFYNGSLAVENVDDTTGAYDIIVRNQSTNRFEKVPSSIGFLWGKSGNDIYNNNTNNVLIGTTSENPNGSRVVIKERASSGSLITFLNSSGAQAGEFSISGTGTSLSIYSATFSEYVTANGFNVSPIGQGFHCSSTGSYFSPVAGGKWSSDGKISYANDETISNDKDLISKKYSDKNKLISYTVATLPSSPAQGDSYLVTDALAPSYLVTIMGGGSVVTPVFYNGTSWVAH